MRLYSWAEHQKISGENFHISLQHADFVTGVDQHGHRDLCEWVVVVEGRMQHSINGEAYQDERGSITLIRPGDIHRISGRNFSLINVVFPPLWLNSLGTLWRTPWLHDQILAGPSPRVRIAEEEFSALESLLMKTLAGGRGVQARHCLTTFFSSLLSGYFSTYLEEKEVHPDNCPDWFRDTLDWINRNAGHNLTLDQLRRKACKCPEHLAREFLKWQGCAPREYLLRQRLNHAANLLIATNTPITEISLMTDFANLSHFCRKFKDHFGLTPREYRLHNSHPITPF